MRFSNFVFAAALALSAGGLRAQTATPDAAAASGPYKVLADTKVGGEGGFDYVDADSVGRKLYVVRSGRGTGRISTYDLDTLKLLTEIPANGGHGVAVDPKSGHGFASSNPVVMFDATTLQPIKSIQVEGNPDGLFYEPFKQQIYILSHSAPNVTVINASDGSIAGTIDLGGQPEEGQSDGLGHAYIDVESGDNVAVVDCATLAVTGHYDISASGTGPAGLSVDAKNRIIFSYCRTPNVCVILNADTGKILTTLPIGVGCDAAEFNPDTLEAFSSQGDGTLTVIKENSPTDFAVEQTVKTKTGAKCSTLDFKTGHVILTTTDYLAPATRPAGAAAGGGPGAGPAGGGPGGPGAGPGGGGPGAGRRGGRGRGRGTPVPGSFQLIVVGKDAAA